MSRLKGEKRSPQRQAEQKALQGYNARHDMMLEERQTTGSWMNTHDDRKDPVPYWRGNRCIMVRLKNTVKGAEAQTYATL